MEEVKFSVTLKPQQLFHFNMYHCYHSFNGYFGMILGLVCIAYAIAFHSRLELGRMIILLILGVAFLVYNPISLYMRSKSRFLATEALKHPIQYQFCEEGILLSQDEVEEKMTWESIWKIVETKEGMFFYLTRSHANIIPLESMGEAYPTVLEYVHNYAKTAKLKLRG